LTLYSSPSQQQYTQVQRYPSYDKKIWGPHYWHTLQELAAMYPKFPTSKQKNEYRLLFKLLLKHLPCSECSDHALDYVKKNPLTNTVMHDNRNFFSYVCEFHNSVNKRKGYKQVDCTSIYDPDGKHDLFCKDCYKQNKSGGNKEIFNDTKANLDEYRRMSIEFIESLCKTDGLPIPKISFTVTTPCSGKTNSCLVVRDKKDYTIFLNPISTSIRTLYHEYRHYYKLMKGEQTTEEDANTYAVENIVKHFGTGPTTSANVANSEVYNDDLPSEDAQIIERVRDNTSDVIDSGSEGIVDTPGEEALVSRRAVPGGTETTTFRRDFNQSFPMYSEVRNKMYQRRQILYKERSESKGILSHFDGVMSRPARWTGIMEQDIGLFHVTMVLKNLIMVTIEGNTTPFGSAMISFLLGLLLFTGGVMFKKSMNYRDIQLVQLLASSFFWNTISYINPKVRPTFMSDARAAITGLKQGNLGMIAEHIFETPKKFKKKAATNLTPTVVPLTGAPVSPRNPTGLSVMRAAAGSPSAQKALASIMASVPAEQGVLGVAPAVPLNAMAVSTEMGNPIPNSPMSEQERGYLYSRPSPYGGNVPSVVNVAGVDEYLDPARYAYGNDSDADIYADDLYYQYLNSYLPPEEQYDPNTAVYAYNEVNRYRNEDNSINIVPNKGLYGT